eukprot:508662-Pleurochrysis_carterae.AAC.3
MSGGARGVGNGMRGVMGKVMPVVTGRAVGVSIDGGARSVECSGARSVECSSARSVECSGACSVECSVVCSLVPMIVCGVVLSLVLAFV